MWSLKPASTHHHFDVLGQVLGAPTQEVRERRLKHTKASHIKAQIEAKIKVSTVILLSQFIWVFQQVFLKQHRGSAGPERSSLCAKHIEDAPDEVFSLCGFTECVCLCLFNTHPGVEHLIPEAAVELLRVCL